MKSHIRRAIVVLLLLINVPELIKQVKAIVLAMTNNANFTTPAPTLAAVTAAIGQLDLAEVLARTKGVGTAQARDVKQAALVLLLRQLQFYVQGIADASATLVLAQAIISSAGMSVRKASGRQKNHDDVQQGHVSGLVTLIARRVVARKVSYFWAWSTDQKTWTSLPMTFDTKTSVSGLTPAVTYYFRYYTLAKKLGTSDFSQTLSLLVK